MADRATIFEYDPFGLKYRCSGCGATESKTVSGALDGSFYESSMRIMHRDDCPELAALRRELTAFHPSLSTPIIKAEFAPAVSWMPSEI